MVEKLLIFIIMLAISVQYSLIGTMTAFNIENTKNIINMEEVYSKNYINSISLLSYTKAREILQEFNKLGDNKIVNFSPIKNGRHIDIREMTKFDMILGNTYLGMAITLYTKCLILIRPGLDDKIFREVLLHEYLHCYGFKHTEQAEDLMYFELNLVDKEENIRQYAIKVKKLYYE